MCKIIIKNRRFFCEKHGRYYSDTPTYNTNESGVYKISIKGTSLFYIGYASHFSRRFRQHKTDLKNGKHCNWKLQQIVNWFGVNILEFIVLEFHNNYKISSYNMEAEYINKLNPQLNIAMPAKDRDFWIKKENMKINPVHC